LPVHSLNMRANINLDADAYSFASMYARARGIPLGVAISELLRRAEAIPKTSGSESSRLVKNSRGYLEIRATGDAITPEMVKNASEDDLV
jgi:hypothetical protein